MPKRWAGGMEEMGVEDEMKSVDGAPTGLRKTGEDRGERAAVPVHVAVGGGEEERGSMGQRRGSPPSLWCPLLERIAETIECVLDKWDMFRCGCFSGRTGSSWSAQGALALSLSRVGAGSGRSS